MERHEQRIVTFLSRPKHYPYPVKTIERRETHVSHVFLAGAFAYKLKKPVLFPFLDASTLARRKRLCELELSLNRRLASAVYVGLLPLVETPDGLRFGQARGIRSSDGMERSRWSGGLRGKGRVIEWLVLMRRLPEEQMLDRLVARGRVSPRHLGQLAERLTVFFQHAARSRRIEAYGKPAQVAELLFGNLQECQPFVGTLLPEADRQGLEEAYRQALALYEPLLMRRVRERRIIDGHGDLRCENICLTHPVTIFDCVEFQPAFRCGDVANDFSFLLMDLEFRGRQDLA
jgi:aminoglycoside phosphotransferase family enzyme